MAKGTMMMVNERKMNITIDRCTKSGEGGGKSEEGGRAHPSQGREVAARSTRDWRSRTARRRASCVLGARHRATPLPGSRAASKRAGRGVGAHRAVKGGVEAVELAVEDALAFEGCNGMVTAWKRHGDGTVKVW